MWEVQYAEKKCRKERAIEGIIMGIRKGIRIESRRTMERERIMESTVVLGGEKWRIVGVYINGGIKEAMAEMREWMEEEESDIKTVIGGDFNTRTGKQGGRRTEGGRDEEEEGRRSKDRKVNMEGKQLVKELEEVGWEIYNGVIEGDEEGNWTYMGPNGKSVIDYVIGGEEVKTRIDSDHMPVTIEIEGEGSRRRKRGKRGDGTG